MKNKIYKRNHIELFSKRNERQIIPLDNLDPSVQEKILASLKKADDSDEEVEDFFMPFTTPSASKALEERGIFFINGEISKQSLSHISNKLLELHFSDFDDEIQLIINSPGGYVDATWAFVDLMQSIRLPIKTISMGEIASAATMIFVTGDRRQMTPNSIAMVHHFSGGNWGTYRDLVATRKYEDLAAEKIIKHFIRHSKFRTEKEVINNILLDQDNYLTPKEMKKLGLCDEILESKPRKRKNTKRRK